jgi:hypothetical protein
MMDFGLFPRFGQHWVNKFDQKQGIFGCFYRTPSTTRLSSINMLWQLSTDC